MATGKTFHNKILDVPGVSAAVCLTALLAATSAFAEAPIIEFSGYINGVMNIWATNAVAPAARVIQMKAADADDSHYADVAFSSTTYKDNKNNVYNVYYLETNWAGSASFRIANVDGSNVRTYTTLGDFTASLAAIPVEIINSTYPASASATNAVDGRVDTYSDGISVSGEQKFTIDFGTNRTIRGVRWAHRRFGQHIDRVRNAVLEYSDTADFSSGAVTALLTFPTATPAYPGYYTFVHEHTFETPVTARYFRYRAANGMYGSLADLELMAADPQFYVEAPTISYSDLTNFYPVISANLYASLSPVSSVVQRASSATGPYHDYGAWTLGSASITVTNVEDAVGALRYYRLRTVCGLPAFEGQVLDGPAVRAIRYRRLDRSWDDETTLLPRVAVMPPYNGASSSDMSKANQAFDGDAGTAPDVYPPGDTRNPAIGLDFGDAGVHIAFVRLLPRNITQGAPRVNMTSLYLCNNEDGSDAFAAVKVSGVKADEWRLLPVPPLAAPNRYVWISAPADGDSLPWWYGNVAEFQMFGWTDVDTRKALSQGAMVIFR